MESTMPFREMQSEGPSHGVGLIDAMKHRPEEGQFGGEATGAEDEEEVEVEVSQFPFA